MGNGMCMQKIHTHFHHLALNIRTRGMNGAGIGIGKWTAYTFAGFAGALFAPCAERDGANG